MTTTITSNASYSALTHNGVEVVKYDGSGLQAASIPDNSIAQAKLNFSPSSITLLGTLTTTSGTTQTLSGLTLTSYKQLFIIVNGVSFTTNVSLTTNGNAMSVLLGTTFTHGMFGAMTVDLGSSIGVSNVDAQPLPLTSTTIASARAVNTGLTTASTSMSFSGGTFDGGSILVYGVK